MSLCCASMVIEVGDLVGRTPSTDPLITSARVMRWFNEAQREIVKKTPGLPHLSTINNTSLDFSSGTSRYSIGDITNPFTDTTEGGLCYLFNVWYQNGLKTVKLHYVHTDEFDMEFPDITHSDFPADKPLYWTRRGSKIETFPRCATSYEGYPLMVSGTWYARDFSAADTTRLSDISGIDQGLIYYAIAEAWGAIGDDAKAASYKLKFSNPSNEGGFLEKWKDSQTIVYEWDSNVFSGCIIE